MTVRFAQCDCTTDARKSIPIGKASGNVSPLMAQDQGIDAPLAGTQENRAMMGR
jgi:hypothetical protein